MAGVKFTINADGSGAEAALKSINRRVSNLSHELNSGLKNTIVEAFSVYAIGEAIKSMVEFADTTIKGAEGLGVTTDKFQALRIAAREANKDMALFERTFQGLEKAASGALGGDTKALNAFRNLGVNEADLKNLNKTDLLSKVMRGTDGMSRSFAEDNLRAIGAGRNAGALMSIKPQLSNITGFTNDLKGQGRIASNDDLNALNELKDKWEEFSDEIKVAAVPALTWLLDTITDFAIGVKQFVSYISTAIGALVGQIDHFDLKGLFRAFGDNLINGFKSLFDNLWDVIRGKISPTEALQNIGAQHASELPRLIEGAFGKGGLDSFNKIMEDKLLEFGEEDKARAKRAEDRRKNRALGQAEFEGPANRQAAVSKTEADKTVLSALTGDNGFLKIGGLAGVDSAYRAERLQRETNEWLKQIAKNTEPDTTQSIPSGEFPEL
jgi:hypothetical protein